MEQCVTVETKGNTLAAKDLKSHLVIANVTTCASRHHKDGFLTTLQVVIPALLHIKYPAN